MAEKESCFFNIKDDSQGIPRQLAEGMSTRVFPGEQAMISIVRMDPGAKGKPHHHPEEQWGYLIEGSGVRITGEERVEVKAGDFWRTPGNQLHTFEAGPQGAVVFDVFAPPRKDYLKPGQGFGS